MRPAAREAWLEASGRIGNASSLHSSGRAVRALVEDAREQVATALGARLAHEVADGLADRSLILIVEGEAELARVAHKDDASGYGHDVGRLFAVGQVRVGLAHLRDRVSDTHADGIGLPSVGQDAVALLAPDAQLLGKVVCGRGNGLVGHGLRSRSPVRATLSRPMSTPQRSGRSCLARPTRSTGALWWHLPHRLR